MKTVTGHTLVSVLHVLCNDIVNYQDYTALMVDE